MARFGGLIAIASALTVALLAGPAASADPIQAQVTVHADQPGAVMRPELQGQFAEHLGHGIYDGIWVGEGSSIPNIHGYRKDVVEALKAIKVPVIRWPGGCFADTYHWRDGIGPQDRRPVRVNTNWGGVEEPNSFGAHEFMNFAELVGAKAYLSANVGSGSPQEASDWLEYLTSDSRSSLASERRANGRDKAWRVDYVGVGNEAWGCGGNMRPGAYADLYRRYSAFLRSSGATPIVKVASGANADDLAWTDTLMAQAGDLIDAISLHFYTIPTGQWAHKGSATEFGEAEWIATLKATLKMDRLIRDHSAVMDKYDPGRRVGLSVDEWGVWLDAEPGSNGAFLYQQNSLRDAVTAAINLDIFQAHADRVRMANIAQMVNVLQAMILTDHEKMVRTPTYYAFDLYQVFQGAVALPVDVAAPDYRFGADSIPGLYASAGRDVAGAVDVALVNPDPSHPVHAEIRLAGLTAHAVRGRILTAPAMNAVNTFDRPDVVKPADFNGAVLKGDVLSVVLPAKAIVVLTLK